jgi:hypothetical protein
MEMLRCLLFVLTVVVGSSPSAAFAADPVFVAPTADGARAAIRGYDPVAYQREAKPVAGDPRFTVTWQGAEWRFASAENRDLFLVDPARYAPAFGGYCAFGTSRGYKVSTDPAAFAIVEGRLYLNHSLPVQRTWDRDRPGYIAQARAVWPGLVDEPYVTDDDSVDRAKAKAEQP